MGSWEESHEGDPVFVEPSSVEDEACGVHDHFARSTGDLVQKHEVWICNDCSDTIADTVTPYVPYV